MCKQIEIVDLPDKEQEKERERRNAKFDKELDEALLAFQDGTVDQTLIKLKAGVDALDKEQDEPLTKGDLQSILDAINNREHSL